MFNPLQDNKILALSKLKAFAENELKTEQNIEFVFHRCRNLCGKRRKCCLSAFFPPSALFSKDYFLRCIKTCHCVV